MTCQQCKNIDPRHSPEATKLGWSRCWLNPELNIQVKMDTTCSEFSEVSKEVQQDRNAYIESLKCPREPYAS